MSGFPDGVDRCKLEAGKLKNIIFAKSNKRTINYERTSCFHFYPF